MQDVITGEHIQALSRELIREFLVARRCGERMPRAIVLFGASIEVMAEIAQSITRELSQREAIDARTDSGSDMTPVAGEKYCINLGYFIALTRQD